MNLVARVRVIEEHLELTVGKEYEVLYCLGFPYILDDAGDERTVYRLDGDTIHPWLEEVKTNTIEEKLDITDENHVTLDLGDAEDAVTKNDKKDGKLSYTFVHPAVLYQVGLAFLWGQQKYGDGWNYLRPEGHTASQLLEAGKRHVDKYFYKREDFDYESSEGVGCPVHHLANAISCFAMALAETLEGTIQDDRPTRPLAVPTTKEEFIKLFEKLGLDFCLETTGGEK